MSLIRRLNVFYPLSIILISTSSVASIFVLFRQDRVDKEVERTSLIIGKLKSLSNDVKETETAVRGYIITSDDLMLSDFAPARAKAWRDLDQLKDLLANKSHFSATLGTLELRLEDRFRLLNEGVKVKRLKNRVPADYILKGNVLSQQILQTLARIEENEKEVMQGHLNELKLHSDVTKIFILLTGVTAICLTILFKRKLHKNYFKSDRQNAILNAMPANIAIIDQLGFITSVNKNWVRFALENGYEGTRFGIGQNYLAITGQEKSDASLRLLQGIKEVINKRLTIFSIDYDCSTSDKARWFRAIVAPLSGREVPEFVIMHVDVTEIKQAENEIKEANERYNLVAKATHDAIWDWNIENGTLFLGDAFDKRYGIKPEYIREIGLWFNHIHSEDKDRIINSLWEVINSSSTSFWCEKYRFRKSDGTYAFIKDDGYVIRDKNGKAVRMVGAMQDRTTLKVQKNQIISQSQRLREIAVINSHEIRKPVANILGIIELLKMSDSREQSELLSLIEMSALELDERVRAIADMTKEPA